MADEGRSDVISDLEGLVDQLSLAQKVRLVTRAAFYSMAEEPEIGLRPIVITDGPAGGRGTTRDDSDPSWCLPSPTAVAASWDAGVAATVGEILAEEAHRKGLTSFSPRRSTCTAARTAVATSSASPRTRFSQGRSRSVGCGRCRAAGWRPR
jgi:hypothetical protein